MEFMKKTKIITSLGPSSYNADTFEQMVLNGANIARVNFSHATPEEKQILAQKLSTLADKVQ